MGARHPALPPAPKVLGSIRERLDAAESIFLEQELERLLSVARDVKYAPTKVREFLPVSNEADPGQDVVSYERGDHVGEAKIVDNYADDVPLVNARTDKETQRIVTLADGFSYSIQDLKAASLARRPLSERLVQIARRVLEEKLEHLAVIGDEKSGIPGFARRSDTLDVTIPNDGEGSSKAWTKKDADKIVRDFNAIVAKMVETTNDVEKPDTLALPPAAYARIASTPRATGSDRTILTWLLENNPWVKDIVSWGRLTTAGGVSMDTTRAVLYRRDPMALELHVPEEFTMQPPEATNLAFKVACTMRSAGTVVYYRKSIVYADGV